jgi:CcmD family protein
VKYLRRANARPVALLFVLSLIIASGSIATAHAQQPRQTPDEFVPIDELPPGEQLAAGPLLVAAYAIVWLVLCWYVWSLWRRLGRVERELETLARRAAEGPRR